MRENLTRREAARLITAGAGGLLLPSGAARAQAANESSAMLMRAIPSSDEKLSAIGLGTWRTFDVDLASDNRRQLDEVLALFVKLGGRVIDTSPMYGRAEQVIGDRTAALGIREKLFFATKVWTHGKQAGIESMKRSMARLRAERIDLVQVHNLLDVDIHLATLRDWKQQGRIRYIGITHYESGAFDEVERLGDRIRLSILGAVLSEMDHSAPGRNLRDPSDRQAASSRRQHSRGNWPAS